MNYIEIKFNLDDSAPYVAEILPECLGQIGFESFYESEDGLKAYIPSDSYNRDALVALLKDMDIAPNAFSECEIPEKNWNVEWESHYDPVIIGDKCLIRAPFHRPDKAYPLEIIIEPKMSFGTGHHETTFLMISEMLEMDFAGRSGLDAGCGTGILAIVAEKRGAAMVMAVDNDDWCLTNAAENIERNNCRNISLQKGEASRVAGFCFDFILANINLNVLTTSMATFAGALNPGGMLLMSGILAGDLENLQKNAEMHRLEFMGSNIKHNWALARFAKK